jgi:YegS/Rv2252/BmrU family lipid kinase
LKKLLLIINPKAASGSKIFQQKKIEKILEEGSFEVTSCIPKDLAEQKQYLEMAADNYDIVVAVGGDGTINNVINGLESGSCDLGFIPLGSENCIARYLGISENPIKACQVIIGRKCKIVDLGIINNRYFLGFASLGFDAGIIHDFEKSPKIKRLSRGQRFLNVPIHILYGTKKFFETQPVKMEVEADNREIPGGYWILFGNIPEYAAGWRLFPKAEIDDGLLDLIIGKNKDIFNTLKYVIASKTGKHLSLPDLSYDRAKNVKITSGEPVKIQADGEYIGTTPAIIKTMPKALKVIIP